MKETKGRNGGTLKTMEKGETLNPKGRPKKTFALLNASLKKEGYKPLKKAHLMEAYSLILSLDEEAIQKIANDKEQPLAIRLIIADLVDDDMRSRTIQDMRNYLFGGYVQNHDVKSDGESINKGFFDLMKSASIVEDR